MNTLLRPKCWLTRHHWLLLHESRKTLYEDNLLARDSIYHYQCQVCGQRRRTNVINLDNAPKNTKGKE